ncbi:MAG TPA: hypothetical protein VFV50_11575 [Bdellovibrionales bacterium]|nr:hypothetical protein [Bdellovibrionales bacterium]
MRSYKSSLFVVSALGAGLVIGFFAGQPTSRLAENPLCPPSESEPGVCGEKLDELRGKFQALSENEIQEYIQLKDMRAKYEKADEIFGKILNIFLLDLGLRISGDRLNELKAAAENAQASPPQGPAQSERGTPGEKLRIASPAAAPGTPGPMPAARPVSRKDLSRASSDEEARKVLDDAILPAPEASWRESDGTSRQHFHMINGTFTGLINFFEDRKPSDVYLELVNATYEKGEIKGQLVMRVTSGDGNSNSTTTTGQGNTIKYFKSASDGAILVETMGGNGLFQLYYFPQLNQFQGNFYGKRGLEPLKREGIVVLTKR